MTDPLQTTSDPGQHVTLRPCAWEIEHQLGAELTMFPSRAEEAARTGATVHPLVRLAIAEQAVGKPSDTNLACKSTQLRLATQWGYVPRDSAEVIAQHAARDPLMSSFWLMLQECESRAHNDGSYLLRLQVEDFYRQWNAATGSDLAPRWNTRGDPI